MHEISPVAAAFILSLLCGPSVGVAERWNKKNRAAATGLLSYILIVSDNTVVSTEISFFFARNIAQRGLQQ